MKKIMETIVIDKSGSMHSIRQQVVTTINERIQQAKQNSQDGDEITINIISFDGNIYENVWGVKATEVPEATTGDYNPNGGTALYDAIAYTLKKIEKTCQDPEMNHLVVVITDGEDTSSTHFNDTNKLKALITEHQTNGKVTLTYVGCDEKKVMKEAQKLGIPITNCASWSNDNTHLAESAFKNLNKRLYKYYDNTKRGIVASNLLSDSPKIECLSQEEANNATVSVDNNQAFLVSAMNNVPSYPTYGIASSCCIGSNAQECMNVAGNYKTKKADWDEVLA
jgi:uncharacterized protein YegL